MQGSKNDVFWFTVSVSTNFWKTVSDTRIISSQVSATCSSCLQIQLHVCCSQEIQVSAEDLSLPPDGLWVCSLANVVSLLQASECLQKLSVQKRDQSSVCEGWSSIPSVTGSSPHHINCRLLICAWYSLVGLHQVLGLCDIRGSYWGWFGDCHRSLVCV